MTLKPQPTEEASVSTESAPPLTPTQQRRKAGQLLLWLQWLLILMLIAMMVWMFILQQRFEQEVLTRLQTSEQVGSRLNEMDDRLYAISQQTLPVQNQPTGSQAQNQLNMLRIQLQAADRLITDSDYPAAVSLLRGLLWQMSQDNNEIAPALTIVLKQSLEHDIDNLLAQSAQPSPWQLHNLAIADIQGYLRQQVTSAESEKQTSDTRRLATYEVMVHETIMTLNLAMQASNMRDKSLLLMYLQQAKEQLLSLQGMEARRLQGITDSTAPLAKTAPRVKSNKAVEDTRAPHPATKESTSQQHLAEMNDSPTANDSDTLPAQETINLASMQDAINWLSKLIAEPPTKVTLTTSQVLDQDKTAAN
ncbi:hypothetical protein [Psychrobacter pygoscelis]|uniref:hypothetical protein n=1 Tax=Psychrobacter pygoscelis TaxID=2488563 RepID=UPI00104041AE|nr:hypothetical protein [Psychrobacter pygoscelis]